MLVGRRLFKIIGILFVSLALIASLYVYKLARDRFNTPQVIFVMDDPAGDDYGPGTYEYPTDSIFDPRKNHLDLIKFSSNEQRNNYYFDLVYPMVTNPWGATEGFSHQIAEIYLSNGSGSGRTEPLQEGIGVVFDPQNPWQYLIKVVSFNRTAVYFASNGDGAEGKSEGITTRLQPDNRTIRVTVPKDLLTGDPYHWRYYVLVGSQEGAGPDNFRVVNKAVSPWNFGGGTDTRYNPNVIDLLAYPGRQEAMLSGYDANRKRFAVIEPVKPETVHFSTRDQFLNQAIAFFQSVGVKL